VVFGANVGIFDTPYVDDSCLSAEVRGATGHH